MTSVCRGDDVSRKIIKSLQALKNEVIQNNELSDSSLEVFKRISTLLSCSLPEVSDPTLLQIDDLLYQNYDLTSLSKIRIAWKEFRLRSFLNLYSKIYVCIVTNMSVMDHNLDTTLLQLIEHPNSKLIRSKHGCRELLLCAYQLIKSRCYKKICQALKFLKIVLEGKVMKQFVNLEDSLVTLYLKNLINIPEARHPEKKRISLWMARQASGLFEDLDIMSLRLNPETQKYLEAYRPEMNNLYDGTYLQLLLDSLNTERTFGMSFHFDHLHKYFMSGQDRDQRILLLENFFRSHLPKDKLYTNLGQRSILGLLMKRCDSVVRHFLYFSDHLLTDVHYSKDILNEIDGYYDYDFEPYISNDVTFLQTTCPLSPSGVNLNDVAKDSNVEKTNKDFSDNEKESTTEEDYVIEKFLVYDCFMKSLEVITILYNACLMICEIIKLEENIETVAGTMFRKSNTPFKELVNIALLEPSSRGNMPWWLLKAVKKCPFLFVSKSQEDSVDDLVKMLEGQEVGQITEERLYFAVNSGSIIRSDMSLNYYHSY